MDLLAELEAMALNIADFDEENSVSGVDAERWQHLFGYTHTEAVRHLEEYRNDYSRTRVPDDFWATVRTQKEAEGYDREAYEYSLTYRVQPQPLATPGPAKNESASGMFIVQLTDPLDTPESIQTAAGLAKTPTLLPGTGDSGQAGFCQIDGGAKASLIAWIAKHHPGFQPMIVKVATKAKKNLCSTTMTPYLGVETPNVPPSPAHDQYPVWYFFYGTLADPSILARQLELAVEPVLTPAHVEGGHIRTWGGKYRALVDGAGKVFGSAFLVESREHEDALCFYETDKYEVVRCSIVTADGRLDGLTFRFAGTEEELD
ncbi:hypothetical protein A1O3_00477 [Capronia epimyces CBS 606.96]|uniref:Putative gamma-glutamylcyclotransferase n=1 Tax=Capronia epimyces CBS 606.96 TaxID=1182542 RepID=W9YGC9_9EURO|nr:uncharacterized protein A1O3_00477 [Capronia epimyces CBS 606.96]EXJ91927.1 hypothetical protein A1O3_00477 [Capronia epimyces CBS 606.96]